MIDKGILFGVKSWAYFEQKLIEALKEFDTEILLNSIKQVFQTFNIEYADTLKYTF